MHDNPAILLGRIQRTNVERIHPAATQKLQTLTVSRLDVTDRENQNTPTKQASTRAAIANPHSPTPGQGEPIGFNEATNATYTPCEIGTTWGPAWGYTWFRFDVEITKELLQAHPAGLELAIDLGWADHSPGFQAEGLVYQQNGEILKAINPKNQWVPGPKTPGKHTYWVEASAVPLLLGLPPFQPTNDGRKTTASPHPIYRLARAELVTIDPQTALLAARLEALAQLAPTLDEKNARRWEILTQTSAAIDHVDLASPQTIRATAKAANDALEPLLAQTPPEGEHRIFAVGHAHIDSAWLWPLRETRKKVARTLANVLRLLDDGADFTFSLPAAQHLAWLEEDYPELFDRVATWIKAGKIIPVGGMWIEPDAVLPTGEALCRQLLEGQSYYLEKFGITCDNVWLPDSFGYNGALPQIAKAGGAKWFLTQKISWNQVDTFPHHTFWWEGIDGTRIFTHFPPADTYCSELNAQQITHARDNFRDKGRTNVSLVPFGYGDGGGGPTREMVERGKIIGSTYGAPHVNFTTPDDFYQAASADYQDAPVWVGELYLELHRGVFTTQAGTKAGNRISENLIRQTELWLTTAAARGLMEYPHQQLRDIWRQILLYQFHDILPGTSIGWVHDEVTAGYHEVAAQLRTLHDQALTVLARHALQKAGLPQDANTATISANPTSFPATSPAPLGAQVQIGGLENENLNTVSTVKVEKTDTGTYVLTNTNVEVTIGTDGCVTSLIDLRTGRQTVAPQQKMGTFSLYQDFPNMWDAWDLDVFYSGSRQILSEASLVELTSLEPLGADSAHRPAVRVIREFGSSKAEIIWSLDADGPLRVQLEIDWQEREKLLKLDLPLDVQTGQAAWETAFGHVWRPLHTNTSWDAYRFEVATHRWTYVEEPGFGVAVANSRTYGWDGRRVERAGGGTYTHLGASLLRSPRFPDPTTDTGHHSFEFTITTGTNLPGAVKAGYDLNTPLAKLQLSSTDNDVCGGNTMPQTFPVAPLVNVGEGVIVESIKMAQDRSGDVIVRLYEYQGARAKTWIEAPEFASIEEADILERPLTDTQSADLTPAMRSQIGSRYFLELRPFQVVTLRLHTV